MPAPVAFRAHGIYPDRRKPEVPRPMNTRRRDLNLSRHRGETIPKMSLGKSRAGRSNVSPNDSLTGTRMDTSVSRATSTRLAGEGTGRPIMAEVSVIGAQFAGLLFGKMSEACGRGRRGLAKTATRRRCRFQRRPLDRTSVISGLP